MLKYLLLFCLIFCSTIMTAEVSDSTKVEPKLTMLEFGANGCYSCEKMKKVMKQFKNKYGDQVTLTFIDITEPENVKLKNKYHIEEIPAQVFLDEDGKPFKYNTGELSVRKIAKIFNKKLDKSEQLK